MSVYISHLNAGLEAEAALQTERMQSDLEAARERLSPLEDRLRRLIATIPDDLQREGLSLSELQKSLRGRWRGYCHPGELGAALRKLGFVRRRCWRDEQGFGAIWYRCGDFPDKRRGLGVGGMSTLAKYPALSVGEGEGSDR